jgi:hypothetical protein
MNNKLSAVLKKIEDLEVFLQEDLYTQFRPAIPINGKIYFRTDTIDNEDQYKEYIAQHFQILKVQVKDIMRRCGE